MQSPASAAKVIETIDITSPPTPVAQPRRLSRKCSRNKRIETVTDLLRKLNVSLNSKLKRERDPRRTKSIQKLEATISEYQRQLDELIGVQSPDKPADSPREKCPLSKVDNIVSP